MKSREVLKVLAEVSESQWGMVTSAQARTRGVSNMNLTRLAESGNLVRLTHGVYRDAGAPSTENEELRAAWLAAEPTKPAWERLKEKPGTVVVSGESASRLHGIGEFRTSRSEFTTPVRKQSQRLDVHYRTRVLTGDDVTVRDGLPVTTRERTIADLVEDRQDLSLVAHALRDAAKQSRLDVDRLTKLLSPLAERNRHPKGDGVALLDNLMEIAGIDAASIANMQASLFASTLSEALNQTVLPTLSGRLKAQLALPSAAIESMQSAIAAALPKDLVGTLMSQTQVALNLATMQAALSSISFGSAHESLTKQFSAIDGARIAQSTHPVGKEASDADS